MPLDISYVDAPLGHHIRGVDLETCDAETFRAVEDAFNRYGVVVIEGQKLTPAGQIAFTNRFGRQIPYPLKDFQLPGYPDIFVVSNIIENGRPIGMSDAGKIWHTDTIFIEEPPRCSVLYALEVPRDAAGEPRGDTLFASSAAAYDALSPAMQAKIDGLQAVNSFRRYTERRIREGEGSMDEASRAARLAGAAKIPDIVHPLVRTHPITGRKCLYISGGTTVEIVGWSQEDSDALIDELQAHMIQPQFVYRHQWTEGDAVIWDNCSAIHLAMFDYALPMRRRMHRTTVEGTRPF